MKNKFILLISMLSLFALTITTMPDTNLSHCQPCDYFEKELED